MLEAVAIALLVLALTGVISYIAALTGAAVLLAFSAISSIAGIWHVRRVAGDIAGRHLVGRRAIVRAALHPEGVVFVQGERWRAALDQGVADAGDLVEIVGVEGFRLRVRKLAS